MAKPVTVPSWDTNATNVTTPAAGYVTDGWTNGEPINSSYFNYFMMWVCLWLAFVNSFFGDNGLIEASTTRWQNVSPRGGIETNVAVAGGDGQGVVATGASAVVANTVTIDVRPGDRISGIKGRVVGTGGAQSVVITLIRHYISAGVAASASCGVLTVVNPPATCADYAVTSGVLLPYTVVDGDMFTIKVEMPLSTTQVIAFGITKDRLNG